MHTYTCTELYTHTYIHTYMYRYTWALCSSWQQPRWRGQWDNPSAPRRGARPAPALLDPRCRTREHQKSAAISPRSFISMLV